MLERTTSYLATGTYDAILCFELSALQHCPQHALPLVVANIEDPASLKLAKMLALPMYSARQRLELALASAFTWRYERMILPRLGRVLLLAEHDVAQFRRWHRKVQIGVMPYGVDCPADDEVLDRAAREEGMIAISGNMFHTPNVHGVIWFLREIFPSVVSRCPTASLYIIGSRPDERISRVAQPFGQKVQITGAVEDMSRYLRKAIVSVCPVRLAIGVQTKTLEALAWGTPVVTTIAGNSGIAGTPGTQLHAEPTPGGMADRIVELLRGDGWARLSSEGRRHAKTSFKWDKSASVLEHHLESIGKRVNAGLG